VKASFCIIISRTAAPHEAGPGSPRNSELPSAQYKNNGQKKWIRDHLDVGGAVFDSRGGFSFATPDGNEHALIPDLS
jgi:hypothetical protein